MHLIAAMTAAAGLINIADYHCSGRSLDLVSGIANMLLSAVLLTEDLLDRKIARAEAESADFAD